jgi:hypothetical protein
MSKLWKAILRHGVAAFATLIWTLCASILSAQTAYYSGVTKTVKTLSDISGVSYGIGHRCERKATSSIVVSLTVQ